MKYFIIEQMKNLPKAPKIKKWMKQINVDDINKKNQYRIAPQTLLEIMPDKDVVFYDVISFPFFLVSEEIHKVIEAFEPNLIFKEVITADIVNHKNKVYYLPILADMDSIHEAGETFIFRTHLNGETKVVVRLELIEAVLRREVKGISLHEIEN